MRAMGQGERFPKSLRLTRRRQFVKVQESGKKVAVGPLLALALPNGGSQTCLGITVTTKVGKAVVRVRIRRRLRELFRKRRGELPAGVDLVLVARNQAATASFEELSSAFGAIARRLKEMFP